MSDTMTNASWTLTALQAIAAVDHSMSIIDRRPGAIPVSIDDLSEEQD